MKYAFLFMILGWLLSFQDTSMVMRIFPKDERHVFRALRMVKSFQYHLINHWIIMLSDVWVFLITSNSLGEAGKLVDSYISDKMLQLKEQIATLEKREERWVYNLLSLVHYMLSQRDSRITETLKISTDTRLCLQTEFQFSGGHAVSFLVTRLVIVYTI